MLLLPHGCSCSQPSVNPKNWKTCRASALKKNWRIQYYFRDPNFKKKYPNGKLIPVKGMNRLKTLEERREITQALLDQEIYMLRVEGYNPITKTYNGPDVEVQSEIDPSTPFCEALSLASLRLTVDKKTIYQVELARRYFSKSIVKLKLDKLKIADVKRKHVRLILERQGLENGYSNDRYNKVRSYIRMLFKQLTECDAIDFNPIDGISKKVTVQKIRDGITDEEMNVIISHLKKNYYTFYRYMEIFFHSGCRSSELMQLKRNHIDLNKQLFKVLVKKKGGKHAEEFRAINDSVLHLWKEICKYADQDDFIFSKGLMPGPKSISEWQISTRWRKHVKIKLGIQKDFYLLKHRHTTKITEYYGKLLAADINGHESSKMNDKHYDLLRKERLLEEAKRVKVVI